MKQIQVNTYTNVTSPAVNDTISIEDHLERIKCPPKEILIKIEEARVFKYQYINTDNEKVKFTSKEKYDAVKLSIPTVTYSALFSGSRKNENFIRGTGLMYIDIDSSDFNPERLDKNKIFSFYKSIGGLGYCILVRVDHLTLKNYDATYLSIVEDLKINSECDLNAKRIGQQSIQSHDPNIFTNYNSFVYSTAKTNIPEKEPTDPINKKKEEHNVTLGLFYKLRYNNIDDFDFNGNAFIEDWVNGSLEYVYCSKPFSLLIDGRKRYMSNYVRNLVCLNPLADGKQICSSAKFVNLSIAKEPLPWVYIENLVNSILKQENEGSLTPKITYRSLIFNPKYGLTKVEKQNLRGERQRIHYNDLYTRKIYDCIEDWSFEHNGKITINSVKSSLGLNVKTVKKRWKNVKNYVAGRNEENKLEIKTYRGVQSKINKDSTDNKLLQLMTDMDVNTLTAQALIEEPDLIGDSGDE